MKTTKKNHYTQPTMRAVELRQHGMLMASNSATMSVTYDEEDI